MTIMYITKTTREQLDDLADALNLSPVGTSLIERLIADAVTDASCKTAEVCRAIASDMLVEQRSRIYESVRRTSAS